MDVTAFALFFAFAELHLVPFCAAAASQPRRSLASLQAIPTTAGGADLSPPALAGLGVGAVGAAAVLTLLAGIAWRRAAREREGKTEAQGAAASKSKGEGAEVSPLLCLSFNDVQVATEGFKPDGVLSDKAHSSVHKAEGPSGEKWAVKRAKGVSLMGEHLFRNEVDFLAKVTHPNILSFQAYSDDCNEQILVFEYMPNGSLSSWLRPPPALAAGRPPLQLSTRLTIAQNIADALSFLHSFSKPTIIHRDVVADSVLLDSQFQAKLGSLGLLKHLPGEGLWMRMAQKKGYLDPEYFQSFKVTAKSDVYSFGVVMLELLTGLPPVIQAASTDQQSQGQQQQRPMTLPQWALQSKTAGKLIEIVDPRMPRDEQNFSLTLVQGFAQIACDCCTPLRKNRPDIVHVAAALRALRDPPGSEAGPAISRASLLARLVKPSARVAPST